MRIGIIYIATGIYTEFWKEFYPTCEAFFCMDAQKGYEVFTDSPELLSMKFHNTYLHPIEDRGFIVNVSSKSKFICEIASELEQKYDYVFYLNGNYKFVEPILSHEILCGPDNDYLTALSFDIYKSKSPGELPYDRNPCCQAYIPLGQGTSYYQGGFYGGRTKEMLLLSQWCASRIEEDLRKKIIAVYHDESYLNRYLLNCHPRKLNEVYGNSSFLNYSGYFKAILLQKESYLDANKLWEVKGAAMDNSLSFLLDDQLQINPIGIVSFSGRLGNQMFQYAYLLYLRSKLGKKRRFYLQATHNELLASVFPIPSSDFLPDELATGISQANSWQSESIFEKQASRMQNLVDSPLPIAHYTGYWQCFEYVNANAVEIRKRFAFPETKLSEASARLLKHIRNTCSVSIHVRRGDYCSAKNRMIYGGICSVRYYRNAMRRMETLLQEQPHYFIFTDDPAWVKKHLHIENSILVDCNQDKNDWEDMMLMSSCRHHIIANSSFSWWGAWLGSFPGKQVIAPEWWYNGVPTPHLLPDAWIRIPVRQPGFETATVVGLLLKDQSNLTLGLWKGKMAIVLFLFRYARRHRNKYCREYAEAQLEYICEHLQLCSSLSFSEGLSGICRAILYLVENGFVRGNPNTLLIEVDSYLAEIVRQKKMQDLSFATGLCGVISYIISRIAFLDVAKRPSVVAKKRLENIIKYFLDDMLERTDKEAIPEKDIPDLLMALQRISKLRIQYEKVVLLNAYCVAHTDHTKYLLPEIYCLSESLDRME